MKSRPTSESNHAVYNSPSVAEEYVRWGADQGLLDAEKAILARVGGAIAGGALLDIGVGAGRTTPALSGACRSYVGIDIAAAMLSRGRQAFPHIDFRQCDARDLGIFGTASFDTVWFSFNGIDYVSPADRERVLAEMARVLVPGGLLVFSSHNLFAVPRPPGLWPAWRRQDPQWRRVLSNARALGQHAAAHVNYQMRKGQQQRGDGWSMLVDSAHRYRLLTCFVTPQHQVDRLRAMGFENIETVAKDGSLVDAASRPTDTWLHYVATRGAQTQEATSLAS